MPVREAATEEKPVEPVKKERALAPDALRRMVVTAMLIAIYVVLDRIVPSIKLPGAKVALSFVAPFVAAILYGPVISMLVYGVGDLIVTCSSHLSRNFTAGEAIGRADSAEEFLRTNTKTVESINTTRIVHQLALENDISMPITEQVYKVLYENKRPSIAIRELLKRELKREFV